MPHVRESKTGLDSGFQVVDSGFQVLDSSFCQWNLDSEFQSLVGFQIPWAVFWIPKPRIPDSTIKIFHGFRNGESFTRGDEEWSFGVAKESKPWSNLVEKLVWEITFPTFASFPVTRKSILASTDVRSIIVGASCIDVTERDRRSTFVDIWMIKLRVGCRVPCAQALPLLAG